MPVVDAAEGRETLISESRALAEGDGGGVRNTAGPERWTLALAESESGPSNWGLVGNIVSPSW